VEFKVLMSVKMLMLVLWVVDMQVDANVSENRNVSFSMCEV
jgi:hypothetical protein